MPSSLVSPIRQLSQVSTMQRRARFTCVSMLRRIRTATKSVVVGLRQPTMSNRASRSPKRSVVSLPSDVDIVLEDHPDELMHAKAAVVDETTAYVSTANPTWSSFANPGEAVVTDALASDVKAVQAAIEHEPRPSSQYVVVGPSQTLREQVMELFHSQHDLRVASEDLSDRLVVDQLLERQALGHHDRILVGDRSSAAQKRSVTWLRHVGVQVRSIASGYMHEKYVDTGDELYVGSANLTRNGLDEAHEVGVVAPTAALPWGAQTLRDDFDANWSRAV